MTTWHSACDVRVLPMLYQKIYNSPCFSPMYHNIYTGISIDDSSKPRAEQGIKHQQQQNPKTKWKQRRAHQPLLLREGPSMLPSRNILHFMVCFAAGRHPFDASRVSMGLSSLRITRTLKNPVRTWHQSISIAFLSSSTSASTICLCSTLSRGFAPFWVRRNSHARNKKINASLLAMKNLFTRNSTRSFE